MSNVFQDPDANTVFVLRLKPKVGYGWQPVAMRLRAVQKRLLRTYGFVCLPNPEPTETHDHTNPTGHGDPAQLPGLSR
jgi:hypothetical protein